MAVKLTLNLFFHNSYVSVHETNVIIALVQMLYKLQKRDLHKICYLSI